MGGFQWKRRQNRREEEEGVFIPKPDKLAIMSSLRPGWVNRPQVAGSPAFLQSHPGSPGHLGRLTR
jgi:hypothetical protein